MSLTNEAQGRISTMAELNFTIEGVEPQRFAIAPALTFKLRVSNTDTTQQVHNVLLQSQIQIESTRRRYNRREQERLVDLFGVPPCWSQTLRPMLWTHAGATVPPFLGSTVADLHVPCTFDFNVAATKYFAGLEDGDVPLAFLFSGSIFYADDDGNLKVARIAWEKEARYRLPVGVWRQMMEHYYPNTAWLCLEREVFERLFEYKCVRGAPTWEQAIGELLALADRPAAPLPRHPSEATA
ncbi:MAG: DUF6084 family protein [Isosphaeraceae bacterium]